MKRIFLFFILKKALLTAPFGPSKPKHSPSFTSRNNLLTTTYIQQEKKIRGGGAKSCKLTFGG